MEASEKITIDYQREISDLLDDIQHQPQEESTMSLDCRAIDKKNEETVDILSLDCRTIDKQNTIEHDAEEVWMELGWRGVIREQDIDGCEWWWTSENRPSWDDIETELLTTYGSPTVNLYLYGPTTMQGNIIMLYCTLSQTTLVPGNSICIEKINFNKALPHIKELYLPCLGVPNYDIYSFNIDPISFEPANTVNMESTLGVQVKTIRVLKCE